MKNKLFLCFRPIDVADSHSVIPKHHSSVKRIYHKQHPTLKTKSRRRNRKDNSITKTGSSSSELSYSTSFVSSTTSSSCSSSTEDDSREDKISSAECDKVVNVSSFCVCLFIFILFVLIYIGKVYAIVITSLGVMLFTLVGCRKLENPM
ncbi:hypothetical protein HAX54_015240 [Datura stramonium]|uniref:Uncharacterized protein n=1 Tax=Datura stramonium TaxID=4076 RepID=A0ABS8TRE5_DATST|nr:hypothetical protein [Datura stramonium]